MDFFLKITVYAVAFMSGMGAYAIYDTPDKQTSWIGAFLLFSILLLSIIDYIHYKFSSNPRK